MTLIARHEPIFRHIYKHVRGDLPKKGRGSRSNFFGGCAANPGGCPRALYRDYEGRYNEWMSKGAETPPVFIVVANNTATSKLIYDWIAGWCDNPDEADETKQRWKTGNLALFRNVENGKPIDRPRTILIDSAQLDSGEADLRRFQENRWRRDRSL